MTLFSQFTIDYTHLYIMKILEKKSISQLTNNLKP